MSLSMSLQLQTHTKTVSLASFTMGQFISQVQQPLGSARNSLIAAKKRKRSSSPSDSDELNEVLDASMRSPRKWVPLYQSLVLTHWHPSCSPPKEEVDHCPVHLPGPVQGGEEFRHHCLCPWEVMASTQGLPLSESLLCLNVQWFLEGDQQGPHWHWCCGSKDHQRM